MEKHWIADSWDGFTPGRWNRATVNVRDFIQKNYTPYEGNEDFLAGPTDATKKLWTPRLCPPSPPTAPAISIRTWSRS